MGWRDTLARFINPQGFGDARPEDPRRSIPYLPFPFASAGITLTMDEALRVSVVWACVDAITKGIASSEWQVFEKEDEDRKRSVDDPLEWLLNVRPNPEMTAIAWREAMLFSALTWGNGYTEIVRNRAGKIIELWPLRPDRMWPTRAPDDDGQGALEYWYFNWRGGWTVLRPDQVLHFRGPSLNGWMGENLIARSARAIALAAAQERFASAYFGNNAVLGTILKYPKTLSDAAHKRLKEDWEEKNATPDKSHKPFILEGGMELEILTVKANEAAVVDQRTFSIEEICRFYGVPPHKVQHLARATNNNIEHQGLEFTRDALAPWVKRLCQEVDAKCFPQRAPWRTSHIDTDWLSYGDMKSRWEAYTLARNTGVYSANDILRMERKNTLGPEGDVRIVPLNMTTLEGLEASVEKIKAETERAKLPPALPPAPGENVSGQPGQGPAAPPAKEAPPTPKKEGSKAMLSATLVLLFSGTLDRFGRKLENREKDLRRKASRTDAEVNAALVELREESTEDVLAEFKEGFNILRNIGIEVPEDDSNTQVLLAMDSVINKQQDPRGAALGVVSRYLKEE